VHRVQRVPDTEASGRIHTSAATVAVLPEAEEVDITINDADLKIDTLRSSGAGGQHVNKTESAIRITHLPTGIVVAMQEDRSQHRNRAKAMAVLRSRLYDHERQKIDSARAAERRGQVGSGDRSERIRTYNFPQGRVSDHRINLTLYKLPQIMEARRWARSSTRSSPSIRPSCSPRRTRDRGHAGNDRRTGPPLPCRLVPQCRTGYARSRCARAGRSRARVRSCGLAAAAQPLGETTARSRASQRAASRRAGCAHHRRRRSSGACAACHAAVLVPRPETETVVELACARRRSQRPCASPHSAPARARSCSRCFRIAERHGRTDIAGDALECARATDAGLASAPDSSRRFARRSRPFDLVVSNPPYVATSDIARLAREVREA
jgi:hypothetical protein